MLRFRGLSITTQWGGVLGAAGWAAFGCEGKDGRFSPPWCPDFVFLSPQRSPDIIDGPVKHPSHLNPSLSRAGQYNPMGGGSWGRLVQLGLGLRVILAVFRSRCAYLVSI